MAAMDIFQKLLGCFKRRRKIKKPTVVAASADASTPRENTEAEQEQASGLLAVTCIGHSHIKHGTVCQDSSLCHQAEDFRLIAVSDGHGSASFPRSDRGSRLACQVTVRACAEFAPGELPSDREQAARDLCARIVTDWRLAVLDDYAQTPFDEGELENVPEKYRDHYRAGRHVEHAYGATLIAVLETAAGALALRCGDGECVAMDERGNISRPIPWNEKCDVNVTTSLCDEDALDEFRWVWLAEPAAAIWIGTDGVDNSYPCPEDLDEFYANLSTRALEQGCDHVVQELRQFLPVLTQRCSQDDISVAAMLRPEALAAARDRLYAYVALRQGLREQEELRRRLKLASRGLREKERALSQGEGDREQLYQQLAVCRQEEAKWSQALSQQEAKLAQLRRDAGVPAE